MAGETPVKIERAKKDGIRVSWRDGSVSELTGEKLRGACPCALCREERGDGSHEKPLTPTKKPSMLQVVESTKEQSLTLEQIQPVGNYAIRLIWGDGHNDGIYHFDLLRELCLS